MYKITTLLDMAKENNNLKSDRELAQVWKVRHVHPYRTKDVIPTDETAKRLSVLTGVKYELVLASCHGAIAKKNNDKDAVKAWRNMFRLAQSMAFVLVFSACLSISPTPSHANNGIDRVTSETNNIYIMRHWLHLDS